MVRWPLRPHFGVADQKRMIDALRDAKHAMVKCSAAEKYGSDIYRKCHAVQEGIDDLVGTVTGDRQLLHERPAITLRTPDELDELATAVFNAVHACPEFQPIEGVDDLEWEGLTAAVRDWRTIRQALEKMPADVVGALAARRQDGVAAARAG